MKFTLNEDQKERLERTVENNNVRIFLQAQKDINFEIGDVLIKNIKQYDWNTGKHLWVTETLNSTNKMPQRYVYVFKDDTGIGYLQKLKVSTGELGDEVFPLTNYDFTSTQFLVDPEYAETSFLGGDFNIKDLHAKSLEQRRIVTKMNRKSGKKFTDLKDLEIFIKDIFDNNNGVFYTADDYTGRYFDCRKITKLLKVKTTAPQMNEWGWRKFKEKEPTQAASCKEVFFIKYDQSGSHNPLYSFSQEVYSYDLLGQIFFKDKPAQEE